MLNRNGVAARARHVAFALCPTVHARDDRSLIETLDALPDVFAQARSLAAKRRLEIGPCTLSRRLVPHTGRPAIRGPDGSIDYDVDSRQHSAIAAAWLACVIAVAAVTGVDSLCTFEAEGFRGLLRPGGRSPAQVVFGAFARRAGAAVTLLDLNARRGAAFVLEGRPDELWLVELSGRRRAAGVRELSLVRPYQIVRMRVPDVSRSALVGMARGWCRQEAS